MFDITIHLSHQPTLCVVIFLRIETSVWLILNKQHEVPQPSPHRTCNGCLDTSVSSSTSRSHGRTRIHIQLKHRNNQCLSLSEHLTLFFSMYLVHPCISGCSCSSLQALAGSRSCDPCGNKRRRCLWHYGPHTQSNEGQSLNKSINTKIAN